MDIKNKEQWEAHFWDACQNGEIEDVRHLCQKKYFDLGWADIHLYDEAGFRWACENGHLDIVKYLLTSLELIEAGHSFANVHAEDEYGFRWICNYGHWDLARWLVLDYGIEKTPAIEEIIQEYPDVQEYFRVRQELKEIQECMVIKNENVPSLNHLNEKSDKRAPKKAKKL